MLDRISIELTNQCRKHCHFCYNHSHPTGATQWEVDELVDLVTDCALAGTKAISFGGGEPLEYPHLCELLERLNGVVFRSFTTNGLLLDVDWIDRLVRVAPDKIHISIHFPESKPEVDRVIAQVSELAAWGIHSGVNLLVARSNLTATQAAAQQLHKSGIKTTLVGTRLSLLSTSLSVLVQDVSRANVTIDRWKIEKSQHQSGRVDEIDIACS
ncbi:radical SAM protein [Chamaesiphon minutus]|uniref:radical SAM protein n=1 Tax=Chamaesiphon minutus TaxID=1173032 RepID=UPI00031D3BB4|nr:radical SAM protein [Chamaesiphon minutus]